MAMLSLANGFDTDDILDFDRSIRRYLGLNGEDPLQYTAEPKIDGLSVLAQLKADERFARIPVIVLTSSAMPEDVRRAYENHVNSYLVKPTEFEDFRRMMELVGSYWFRWNQRSSSAICQSLEPRSGVMCAFGSFISSLT